MSPEKIILPLFILVGLVGITISAAGSEEEALATPKGAVEGAPTFVDRFSHIDRKRWYVSDGWKVGDYVLHDWRSSQTSLGDGLNLTLAPNKTKIAEYSSGEVQSQAIYGHGYFESRLRAAPGSGVVTGFFTYIGPHFKKPWHEIDVEILGARPDHIQVTYFTDGKKVKQTLPLGFDATKTFHLYGFDWQADAIRWYVDGKLIHEAKGAVVPLPSEPQKIMVSVLGSDTLRSWLGPFDAKALPTTATFSCVAYSKDFASRQSCK